MNHHDKKRLLQAWLANRARIFAIAKRHAHYFTAEPGDLVQMIWEIVASRATFGPGDNVVWRAQDAIWNLVKNRRRSENYKRERFFSGKTRSPVEDYADSEWVDEAGEEFDDESGHAHPAPGPQLLLLEKERVEIYRVFLAELKKSLDSVELAIVVAGEQDDDDTTDLQKKLKCTRNRIYQARFTLKQKGLELRKRWLEAGRELPGFDEQVLRPRPAAGPVVVKMEDWKKP